VRRQALKKCQELEKKKAEEEAEKNIWIIGVGEGAAMPPPAFQNCYKENQRLFARETKPKK